ncbi:hypothetical protein [Polyangium jinanense]|uniref:Uncharacterized protein n=1 Tax=Polyangium jinanense TaxID=2829994 RepID=A0A9X3XI13_9BACT|nr:hypothetical protein [Polyangium jinanense]MDC3962614.1 hypothetical protein [Polyangium jinanense]MDC3989058.1 hypothetical protein [Polyangium jinanense]
MALAAAAFALSSPASALEAEEREAPEEESVAEFEAAIEDFSLLWTRVSSRAWSDARFKQELLANPARALETHFNFRVPRGASLEIVEGRPGQPVTSELMVTIPRRPASGPAVVPDLFASSEPWGRVVTKAWSDARFKQELLANPARALATHFNYRVPRGVRLTVVEGRPGQPAASRLKVTLPPTPTIGPYGIPRAFC